VKSHPWQNATGIPASCAQPPQRLIGFGVIPALLSMLCLCDFIFVLNFKLIGIHGRLKELNYQKNIALVQN
jgi:hypothetical protein